VVGRASGETEKRGSGEITFRRYIRGNCLGAAEPWVAPSTARQPSGLAFAILWRAISRSDHLSNIPEPRPTELLELLELLLY
jgi:hypothetical protein